MMIFRILRRLLKGTDRPNPFARVSTATQIIPIVVRIYYVCLLYLFAEGYLHRLAEWAVLDAVELALLWPIENSKNSRRVQRMTMLTVFWSAQALLLWFYTMSGAWKIQTGFIQMLAGEIHAFHLQAMANQIANRLLQDNSSSLLGPFLVEYPFLG